MIILKECSLKVFGKKLAQKIDLSVRPQEIVGIVAPSGFGKTSLFRAMFKHDGYMLDGDIEFDPSSSGYVPQKGGMVDWLTVDQNAELFFSDKKNPPIPKELNIMHLGSRRSDTLSGGEYQRCMLWLGISLAKRAIILDEPFTGLDVAVKETSINWLKEQVKNKKLEVILATHDIDMIYSLCNRVAVLSTHKTSVVEVDGTMSQTELKNRVIDLF